MALSRAVTVETTRMLGVYFPSRSQLTHLTDDSLGHIPQNLLQALEQINNRLEDIEQSIRMNVASNFQSETCQLQLPYTIT